MVSKVEYSPSGHWLHDVQWVGPLGVDSGIYILINYRPSIITIIGSFILKCDTDNPDTA